MSKCPPSLQQQRELLELEAQKVRLKYMAAQIQLQQQKAPPIDYLRGVRLLAESVPLSGLAIKAITRPKRWYNKFLLGTAVAALAWLNKR